MKNPTSAANTTSLASRDDVIDIAKAAFDDSMCYKSYAKAISDSSSVLKWGKYSYSKNKTSQGGFMETPLLLLVSMVVDKLTIHKTPYLRLATEMPQVATLPKTVLSSTTLPPPTVVILAT